MDREKHREINSSLFTAVHEGDLERTQELINRYGLSYCAAWSKGYVLLRDAIERNHIKIAKLLLTKSCKVNSVTSSNYPTNTPLHFAVSTGNLEIVQMLLDKGANINAKNNAGNTPIQIAFKDKRIKICTLLVKYKADVNVQDEDGLSPFHAAVEEGNLKTIEFFLKHGANVNSVSTSKYRNHYAPLHTAVENGSKEVVALLLRENANVDIKGDGDITPLHIAAQKGYTTIAENLISHGANIHSVTNEGYMPIHSASKKENDETLKILLNKGADINAGTKSDLTPLHIATNLGNKGVVKLLIQNGAKVDVQDLDGKTALYYAVEKGHATIVDEVLKYRPDTNHSKNVLKTAVLGKGEQFNKICGELIKYGFTVNPEEVNNAELLHAAVEKGQLKIVEDLLKFGADVNTLHNSTCNKDFTLLHTAAKNKQEGITKLLLSYGADASARDQNGKIPLFYAIEREDLETTELILNYRADGKDCLDINCSDKDGKTALHYTAQSLSSSIEFCFPDRVYTTENEKEHITKIKGEIAKLLLSKGANVDAQTTCGTTALHLAIKNGFTEIVEALLEYKVNLNINYGEERDITPLHLCAEKGNKEICTMLLNKGLNVNGKQKDGTTALHIATKWCKIEVVKILLDQGAMVDSKDEHRRTPLHLSGNENYSGIHNITDILLKFGADINSRDKYGRTALFYASQKRRLEVVETLLHHGADINITCLNNQTPLEQAMSRLKFEVEYRVTHNYFALPERKDQFASDFAVGEAFKRHIFKLNAANLYVSDANFQSISAFLFVNTMTNDFYNECVDEIINLKHEKIGDANISFYDILAKDTSSLAIPYMRNDNIVQVLKSNDYRTKFPIYAGMIEGKFISAMGKKCLLEKAIKICPSIFENQPKLPYNCSETILSYLNTEELRGFLDACELLPGIVKQYDFPINE